MKRAWPFLSNRNRPNILLITDVFPPQIGGPATFMSYLAEKLAEDHGFRVTVVCTSDSPTDGTDKSRPYVVRRLYRNGSLRYKLEMRQLLAKEVFVHHYILVNGLEALAYQFARILRRPYILKIVGDSVWEWARNTGTTSLDFQRFQVDKDEIRKFKPWIEKRDRIALSARHIVTPSDYLKDTVIRWGVPPERVTTIPNGVRHDHSLDIRDRTRTSGPLHVLFVGRLTNWKGVETLLLALSHIDNVRATIVGDGPEFPHLIELSRQLCLAGRVEFTGRLSQGEVEQRMVNAHALVLTSLYEGMSHTLLEAMAAGLACIASNCGGNAEIIAAGKNGVLIEPQNVQELTAALKLLEADEDLRQCLSKEARVSSINFSMDRMVQGYINLLMQQEGSTSH